MKDRERRTEPSLQSNAADPEQLAYAERVTNEQESRGSGLWLTQMSTPQGREFVWMVLGMLGLYESGINLTRDQLFALEGRRDIARKIVAQLTTRLPQHYLEMQGESMARAERQARESEAIRKRRNQER